jgi:hypothetical protein
MQTHYRPFSQRVCLASIHTYHYQHNLLTLSRNSAQGAAASIPAKRPNQQSNQKSNDKPKKKSNKKSNNNSSNKKAPTATETTIPATVPAAATSMPTPEWIANLTAKIYQDVSARYQASINPQGLSTSFDTSQPVANSQGPSTFSAASDLNATMPQWQPAASP